MGHSDSAGSGTGEHETRTPAEDEAPTAPRAADLSSIPPSQRGIRRRPLVPLWAAAVLAAAVLAAAGAVAAWQFLGGRTVEVPPVTGLAYEEAADRLSAAGLTPRRGDERFSPEFPEGTVVEQVPAAGARLRSGAEVVLVVSAGTETFLMPDVVGRPLEDARRLLTQRGLAVRVEVVQSEAASGTVVSTVPAPGATVTTSDVVRLTVAGSGSASSALLPYRMEGLSFAIDPTPVATGTLDAPLEVARRLRSLLEASGATVTVTRSLADPEPSARARARTAAEATPTALVGLGVAARGEGGVAVILPPAAEGRSAFQSDSEALAQRMAAELRGERRVVTVLTERDAVISRVPAPGARVRLGSAGSREDELAFRDPRWTDEIARAVYRALGEVFVRR
ncbi:MAG: PASTA domain-containing protein [Coriobacteriia bacterium]|nr:PASTA domain-containing protein [Coriobacteriia bacterium]